jgi:hypothetical protein
MIKTVEVQAPIRVQVRCDWDAMSFDRDKEFRVPCPNCNGMNERYTRVMGAKTGQASIGDRWMLSLPQYVFCTSCTNELG